MTRNLKSLKVDMDKMIPSSFRLHVHVSFDKTPTISRLILC